MTFRVTADDMMTGLLSALATHNTRRISLRNEQFDRSLAEAWEEAVKSEEAKDLNFRFSIFLHPLHGDSQTIRDAIAGAVQRDLASLDNPEYQDLRLKFDKEAAEQFLEELPGGPDFYLKLAENFLKHYHAP